jgi:dihydrodipicolinate synthase/N-acetylneuraminate lyase
MNYDGTVDSHRLKRLTEHLCQKDIAGLWVLGTGSEDMSLTFRQRIAVAQTVCEADTQGKKILIGASFFSHYETRDFLRELHDLEFDGIHFMPYHPLVSKDRIEWAYQDLAENSPKPVWLYFSGNWSQTLSHKSISKLSLHENIAGVKFSSSNIISVQKALELESPKFQVMTAVVRSLYSCLHMGVSAATTVEACAFHKPIIEIFNLFRDKDFDAAKVAQLRLNSFLDDFPKSPGMDNFLKVAESKYVLSKEDYCLEAMTPPYRELEDSEKLEIDNLIAKHRDWVLE